MASEKSPCITPRIILHGGAGNITRENLPPESYNAYRTALIDILHDAHSRLKLPGATALDVATHAVSQLENNPLFNAGHGAVYTTAGTHELEASVMVSRGYAKRGVGVMKVRRVKNPIKLAREMLMRGEEEGGGGAGGHSQLEGSTCDRLAEVWGLEMVRPSYFWTKRRWDEHRRGLGKGTEDETYERDKRRADEEGKDGCSLEGVRGDEVVADAAALVDNPSWDGKEYLPQGTVGAVVLDSTGTICAATSTGGLTNKLPGRIGDTPTLGAGFWAEEWQSSHTVPFQSEPPAATSFASIVSDCLPDFANYLPSSSRTDPTPKTKQIHRTRAVGMSGTGNGDSFLRLSAVRTTAAMARFSGTIPSLNNLVSEPSHTVSLQHAISLMAGPNGMLQNSAEDRWLKTGEGQGGIIGIEFDEKRSKICFDFNCGGMFHAWVDDEGVERFSVFQKRMGESLREGVVGGDRFAKMDWRLRLLKGV